MSTTMAARPPAPGKALTGANAGSPNQTLYIFNLNDKISTEDLRRELYLLFSSYGPILDIVTHRKSKSGKNMRGQAHVCFRDVQTSTQAMRGVNNLEFLGREVRVQYGRGTSGIIERLSGGFVEKTTAQESVGTGTELQRSVFGGVPLPSKPTGVDGNVNGGGGPHGIKRAREEDEEKEDDNQSVEMEEDDEDDAPMEEDDDD